MRFNAELKPLLCLAQRSGIRGWDYLFGHRSIVCSTAPVRGSKASAATTRVLDDYVIESTRSGAAKPVGPSYTCPDPSGPARSFNPRAVQGGVWGPLEDFRHGGHTDGSDRMVLNLGQRNGSTTDATVRFGAEFNACIFPACLPGGTGR